MNTMELLKNKAIKATKARIIIYNIISDCDCGITAEYIHNKCLESNISINLSTVYRSLDLFEEKGLVEKYDFGEGTYNYTLKKHDHKHLLECSLCHKEIELQCPMQQIEELVKSKTGFTLAEHELKMTGICKDCKNHKH
ncbi:Fur family transcriptional regulator [Clostridium algidicarnis]|uniref:Fur family transcriptional regulator n=1 Tax=Clostridium algidicarnis TaxID=37659 RepID=UPI001C0E7C5E|nr:Fur family transcriptional regulator [Clostridium algidicarnis]MBU3196168.1 transcriptional repressor [Clostridium algidicarnis]MBU3209210.1 transcriptional repressor [Clostridium algidicarnis]MBU3228859.1 transcriptional repressor [Clostridium algidicarnis]MBU3252423.1 transcriptional repressor [Clostridium algidicarnis]